MAFDEITISLEDFGVPSTIEEKSISVRQGTNGDAPAAVDVSGTDIVIELPDLDGDVTTGLGILLNVDITVVIRQNAGITAPTAADEYPVTAAYNDEDAVELGTVTISRTLTTDPDEGGGGTEITVSGMAFADGTGTLYTDAVIEPDFNEDGNFDAIVDGSDVGVAAVAPTALLTNDYTLDVDGDGAGDYQLRLDTNVYVVVPGDHSGAIGTAAVDVGYTISLAPAPTPPAATPVAGTPTIDTPDVDPARSSLKSVTAADGAFETAVDAADLEKAALDGRGVITFADSNGDEASVVFTVTGTTTLGSDSVGKGKLLEITISDWVTEVPDRVRIDGQLVDIVDADGDDYSVALTDGEDTFYVKVNGNVGLGTKTVVLFDGDARLDSATVEITAIGLDASPSTAVVGQEVSITGSGFTGDVESIMVGDASVCDNMADCDIEVASGGRVVAAFDVPNDAVLAGDGDYTIELTDTDGRIGTATLTIPEPTLTVDPSEGRIGTTVNVSGAGWPTGTGANLVAIHYDGIQYITAISSSDGTWWASLTVPTTAEVGRTNTIMATATVGGTVVTEPNVKQEADHKTPDPVVSLSSGQAQRGTTVTVSGDNFHVFETVTIEIGDSTVTPSPAPTTDGTGSFSADVLVPGLGLGNKNLKVSVRGFPVVEFLEIVATPVSTSMASADAFASLITAGNLTVVWHFENATKAWSFYDPRPAVAGAVDLNEVSSGNNVWIRVTADQMFQGDMLTAGWNLVTLD